MDPIPVADLGLSPSSLAYLRCWLDAYCEAETSMARSGQNRESVHGKGVAELLSTPGAVGSGVRKARRVRERPPTAKNTATGEGPMPRRGVSS